MNETLFIVFMIFLFSLNIIALRMGKVYIFVLITVYSIFLNIFVLKQFSLFGFMTAGGNAMYGAIFLLTDLVNEHYGAKEARKAVFIGFFSLLIFVIFSQVLLKFTPNEYDFAHGHLETLFSLMPRILVGSLAAYLVAQLLDITIYNKIKKWTNNKYLFLRNNISTLVSQFIDTIVFTAVGMTAFSFLPFEGIFQPEQFWEVVLVAYVIKIGVSLLDTPFMYLSYKFKPKKD
jgi:queuosine precursor transporter